MPARSPPPNCSSRAESRFLEDLAALRERIGRGRLKAKDKIERVEAHVFISVLAYHLLTYIREASRATGETRDWKTPRRLLCTHSLVTTALPLNPESEVDRRHSAPSFVAQGLPALGAASLDAARFGTASPCASKHGTDCLALNFGFRAERWTGAAHPQTLGTRRRTGPDLPESGHRLEIGLPTCQILRPTMTIL